MQGLSENNDLFDLFLVATPGLEDTLAQEVKAAGFKGSKTETGGVALKGTWSDMVRANLELRTATRVLLRIGAFPVSHMAQLDKRARAFPWGQWLRTGQTIAIESSASKSKLYHTGAITQRFATALTDVFGAKVDDDASLRLLARIENNICTLSIDTTGGSLHKRGHKQKMHKAPLRETLAAAFLMQCGYTGTETVVDPMCGSGTFIIEAAEIASGLKPGRNRRFAFEEMPQFAQRPATPQATATPHRFFGFDRDAGAIAMAKSNAVAAGVASLTAFKHQPITLLVPPDTPPGLVIVNPPYGERLGDNRQLFGLYGALGKVLRDRFAGWRVGIITSDTGLAKATGLPFLPTAKPVLNGGIRVRLFRTEPLA